jgi:PAS domain S-box-containing protein
MTMKRTSLHLDARDLRALERLSQAETKRSGSRVSASQIVRRLIREFLQKDPPTREATIVRDQDGTIRYWSREAELIYGWTSQEVLGTRTHKLFKTKFPASLSTIEKEARQKLSWEGQLVHSRRDGSLVAVNSRWDIQQNPQDKSITVIEVNAKRS